MHFTLAWLVGFRQVALMGWPLRVAHLLVSVNVCRKDALLGLLAFFLVGCQWGDLIALGTLTTRVVLLLVTVEFMVWTAGVDIELSIASKLLMTGLQRSQ